MDHFTRDKKSDHAGDACFCFYEFKKARYVALES